jgi:tetratricopeptide (TPR) repeat protein
MFQDQWYLLFRGLLDLAQGRPHEAEGLVLKALEGDRQRGLRALLIFRTIWFLSVLVECAVAQHAFDRADNYIGELDRIVAEVGGPVARAHLTRAQGLRALGTQDFALAARLLRESSELWPRGDWARERGQAWRDLSEAESKLGHPEKSEVALEEAIKVFRALRAKPDLERALSKQRELLRGRENR